MTTLLLRNATVLVTMDATRREIAGGGVFVRDGWIEAVGPTSELPATADTVLDCTDQVVLPGLINTHHHLYQSLTRAVLGAQDAPLFDWLRRLYPIWARLTSEAVRVSTQVGLAELARSGCTTTSDHLYLFPNGSRLDDEIEAARPLGVRLHASRGSMSLGESQGGLPPDSVVEDEGAILTDTARLIETHHDPSPGSMLRVVVAPCSPFSVTADGMREAAAMARSYRVQLHTHLAETADEEQYCLDRFGVRPLGLAEQLGWMGPEVWFAHGVFMNDSEIRQMAATGTGVAHCPTSNMRLGSGIAPLAGYLAAGLRVGLGVDGSASNDGGHLLGEARQAMLLARLAAAPAGPMLSARTALELATRGGAAVLGREELGSLEPGKAADLISFDLNRIEYAGALHDPVAALLLCAPTPVTHNYVHGRPVIHAGELVTLDLEPLLARHNRIAREMVAAD